LEGPEQDVLTRLFGYAPDLERAYTLRGVQLKVKEMSERGEGEGARQGKVC
jgi:hypothetical protein